MSDPARDDLLRLRDVHGQRLSTIETRLREIERDLSEFDGWLVRRFNAIDEHFYAVGVKLDAVLANLDIPHNDDGS